MLSISYNLTFLTTIALVLFVVMLRAIYPRNHNVTAIYLIAIWHFFYQILGYPDTIGQLFDPRILLVLAFLIDCFFLCFEHKRVERKIQMSDIVILFFEFGILIPVSVYWLRIFQTFSDGIQSMIYCLLAYNINKPGYHLEILHNKSYLYILYLLKIYYRFDL